MLICSLLFSSWICFQPQPITCNPIKYEKTAIATAYTLSVQETDKEPCIGAGSHNLCDIVREQPDKCIVATRLYKLHTIIFIKGFGECEVLDRTSLKYKDRIDILFPDRESALKFGKHQVLYKIIK